MESPCLIIRGESQRAARSKYPTVICVGAGKPFPDTRDVLVYPDFDRARIKGLSRLPDGRFAVRLKGVPRRRLQAGAVIIAGGVPVLRSRIGYGISLRAIPQGIYQLRGGAFREHALPGTVTVTPAPSGYRLSSSADLPLIPGASYRLFPFESEPAPRLRPRPKGARLQRGGAGAAGADPRPSGLRAPVAAASADEAPERKPLPYEVLLCVPVEVGRAEHRSIGAALEQAGRTVSLQRIAAVNVGLLGWAFVPGRIESRAVEEELRKLEPPINDGSIHGLRELPGDGGTKAILTSGFFDRLAKGIEKALKHAGGEKVDAVSRRTGFPAELVRIVTGELERTAHLVRESGVLIPSGVRAGLSPIEKGVLESLRTGFESKGFVRAGKGIESRVLEKLVDVRLAARVGDRYCAMDIFESLIDRLLLGRNPGEAIDVATARQILGLPREQTIQFLELLDEDGLLRREDRVHRVVRGPRSKR